MIQKQLGVIDNGRWQFCFRIADRGLQPIEVNCPRRCYQPVFCQMPTQRINCLGLLSYKQVTGSECHCGCLFLRALHAHKTHGRTRCRLRNGLSVICIVLLSFDIKLYVDGWDHLDGMARLSDLARPKMGAGASLHGHGAGWNTCQERQQLWSPHFPSKHRPPISRRSVNLKYVLRQIDANYANLFHGRLLLKVVITPPVWHIDAVGGASTPSDTYERLPRTCEKSFANSSRYIQMGSNRHFPQRRVSKACDTILPPTGIDPLVRGLSRHSNAKCDFWRLSVKARRFKVLFSILTQNRVMAYRADIDGLRAVAVMASSVWCANCNDTILQIHSLFPANLMPISCDTKPDQKSKSRINGMRSGYLTETEESARPTGTVGRALLKDR